MFTHLSRVRVVGFWFGIVALVGAAVATVDPGLLLRNLLLLTTVSVTPPAILWLVWRGTPPPTAAELLYIVRNTKGGRS